MKKPKKDTCTKVEEMLLNQACRNDEERLPSRANISKEKRNTIIRSFFNFYALISLDYYCGEAGKEINHRKKASAITSATETEVLSLFDKVHKCLDYSVRKEIRHTGQETWDVEEGEEVKLPNGDITTEANNIAVEIVRSIYKKKSQYVPALCKYAELKFVQKLTYDQMRRIFQADGWEESFGGPLWAAATEKLMEHPKSIASKIAWIDQVFDMQHNCGFLLDKTEFACVSSSRIKFKHRKGIRSPLNYRAEAKLMELAEKASPRVLQLCTANLLKLPKAVI